MPKIKQITAIVKKTSALTYTAIALTVLFILAGSIVSVIRYWQYEVFYYDFGIFDTAIWKVAHFLPPTIDHLALSGKLIFADHFSPSIFLLSPLYWFTSHSEILLITQAIAVGLSGLVLYFIGKALLKNQLLPLSILVSYFLFLGLQNAVITDFHEVTVSLLPFMITILSFLKKNKLLYFLALIIFLGFKESNFLVGVGLGIAFFFLDKSWRKIALITILIAIVWGIFSIKVVIPFFSGGTYLYNADISFNPFIMLPTFVDSPIKLHTLLYSFWSFGFLPLLSPAFWALIFQDFLTRFYSPDWAPRWTMAFHYSALTSAIFAVSSIFSLKWITNVFHKKLISNIIAIVLILNAIFLYRFVLHGPFALAYNTAFYAHTKDFGFLNNLVAHVPQGGSVMTSNNLAVHFIHHHAQVYLFRMDYTKFSPKYIVFDLRAGQNPNNTYGIKNQMQLFQLVSKDMNYQQIYHTGDQYIFAKK